MRAGAVEAKSAEVVRTFAFDGHVGEEASEQRRELEPVRRAETDGDAGMPWESIDDEVTVRRQGVQAALGPDGTAGTGDDLAHERRKSFPHHVIRCHHFGRRP